MTKITAAVSDEVAEWLRARAAQEGCTVADLLVEMVEETMRGEDDYDVAMARFLERAGEPRKLDWADGRRPTREDLYDRCGRSRSALSASTDDA